MNEYRGDQGLYLAIDQGGHASRAVLFDRRGRTVAHAAVPITTYHPAPQQVEHDAEAMVASVREAVAEVTGQVAERVPIIAAGLATQRSTIVCWDRRNGRALSPILSWQDRRMADWLSGLSHAEPFIQQRTGLVLSPHYGASKLRWCLDRLPEVQTALEEGRLAAGPLASFLTARLTAEGNILADPANASRTLLFNLTTADWDPDLLNLFGIPAAVLPACVPSRHAFGHLVIGRRRIPLTVVTGDQSAALFGFGPIDPDTVLINLGTGAFLQRPTPARPAPTRLLTSLAYADAERCTYVLEGTVNGAGSALSWAAAQLKITDAEITAGLPDWMAQTPSPPLFINGVAGLGSPYWRPELPSYFVGGGNAAAKLTAVIESIVFLLQVNLELMAETAGKPAQTLIVSGGLARLDGLCQRLADLGGTTVMRPEQTEATARGLAWLMADPSAGFESSSKARSFSPTHHPALQARYQRWRREVEQA